MIYRSSKQNNTLDTPITTIFIEIYSFLIIKRHGNVEMKIQFPHPRTELLLARKIFFIFQLNPPTLSTFLFIKLKTYCQKKHKNFFPPFPNRRDFVV